MAHLLFVVLWTCFPEAYASIWLTLFVPLTLAAFGIVLRGASFAFRKARLAHPGPPELRRRFRHSRRSSFRSSWAPSPGDRIRTRARRREGRRPCRRWINPTSMLGGVLAVVHPAPSRRSTSCRRPSPRRRQDGRILPATRRRRLHRRRAVAGHRHLRPRRDADYLFDGLTSRALPLVIASLLLRRHGHPRAAHPRRAERGAPLAAVGATASVVIAWGVAQWDYLLPETLTVSQGAAARPAPSQRSWSPQGSPSSSSSPPSCSSTPLIRRASCLRRAVRSRPFRARALADRRGPPLARCHGARAAEPPVGWLR